MRAPAGQRLSLVQCTVRRRRLAPGVDPPRPGSAAGVHAHTALLADDNTRDVARQRRLEEATAEVVALAPDLAECSEMVQQMRRVGPDTLNRCVRAPGRALAVPWAYAAMLRERRNSFLDKSAGCTAQHEGYASGGFRHDRQHSRDPTHAASQPYAVSSAPRPQLSSRIRLRSAL
jgi:hypothetical protein